MKIGMPQLFEYDNIIDNLELAKSLDLDFIELNLNFSNTRWEMEHNSLKELFARYNIEATLHFYDEADFGSYDEVVGAYLILLERYLKLGKDYIKQLNIHLIPGPVVTIAGIKNYIYEKEYDEYLKRLLTNLSKTKTICDKYNINLVIENTDLIPNYEINVYDVLKQKGFRFCYDIGHDYLSSFIIKNNLDKLELPFDEFHIHDGASNKCHLALSEGQIDFSSFLDLIKINDSYVVLEVKQKSDLIKSVPIFKSLIKK